MGGGWAVDVEEEGRMVGWGGEGGEGDEFD